MLWPPTKHTHFYLKLIMLGSDLKCPKGHTTLVRLVSQNRYWCCECRYYYPFKLKEGQKSVLIKGLVGTEDEK